MGADDPYYHPVAASVRVRMECPGCGHDLSAESEAHKDDSFTLECDCGTEVHVRVPPVVVEATNEAINDGEQGWVCSVPECRQAIPIGHDDLCVCVRCHEAFCRAHLPNYDKAFSDHICVGCLAKEPPPPAYEYFTRGHNGVWHIAPAFSHLPLPQRNVGAALCGYPVTYRFATSKTDPTGPRNQHGPVCRKCAGLMAAAAKEVQHAG